jgi:hypothetical protein
VFILWQIANLLVFVFATGFTRTITSGSTSAGFSTLQDIENLA